MPGTVFLRNGSHNTQSHTGSVTMRFERRCAKINRNTKFYSKSISIARYFPQPEWTPSLTITEKNTIRVWGRTYLRSAESAQVEGRENRRFSKRIYLGTTTSFATRPIRRRYTNISKVARFRDYTSYSRELKKLLQALATGFLDFPFLQTCKKICSGCQRNTTFSLFPPVRPFARSPIPTRSGGTP